MNNCGKIENSAPIFGSEKRPAVKVDSLDSMKDVLQDIVSYNLKEGETFQFPEIENANVVKQLVREGSKGYQYLIEGIRTSHGVSSPSWLSLNSLMKRDADRNFVMPQWNCGDGEKLVSKLCEVGKVECKKSAEIDVQVFVNGAPQYHVSVTEDGKTIQTPITKKQTVGIVTACA